MIELNKIYNEDCLIGMQRIPDGAVDAIICDLPYGTMKGAALDGWGGTATDWDTIIPTDLLFKQYERVLRVNGVAILFSQEPYTSHLRTFKHCNSNFEFCYPMYWKKNHFANALIAKKAPVSYIEDMSVFFKRHDSAMAHPLRDYFAKMLSFIGSKKQVIAEIGGKADHVFRSGSTQFSLCTEQTYIELIEKFGVDKMEGFIPYVELTKIDCRFNRTFNLNGEGHLSNCLEYSKDYKDTFHPTQKPVDLIAYLIRTYTNEGDTILDNCMGSGTTAIAAIRERRNYIGFEMNTDYWQKANERIKRELSNPPSTSTNNSQLKLTSK